MSASQQPHTSDTLRQMCEAFPVITPRAPWQTDHNTAFREHVAAAFQPIPNAMFPDIHKAAPEFRPDYATHPGETLAEFMHAAQISPANGARYLLGWTEKDLLEFLAGEARVDEQRAGDLSRAFGPNREFWLALQSNHDAAKNLDGSPGS